MTYVRINDGEQMACGLQTLLLMELKDDTRVTCRGVLVLMYMCTRTLFISC
jgi:hypothetical protein